MSGRYDMARAHAARIRDELRAQLGRAASRRERGALALLGDAASPGLVVDDSFRVALMRRARHELVMAARDRDVDERREAIRSAVRQLTAVIGASVIDDAPASPSRAAEREVAS